MSKILNSIVVVTAMLAISFTPTIVRASNPKPFTVPEVKEWKGADGSFNVSPSIRIVVATPSLEEVAVQFADDYAAMFGSRPEVTFSGNGAGNIILKLKDDKKLGDEGYRISIEKKGIEITAATLAGIRWATRTLLQMREAGEDLPLGTVTDLPRYDFRGFMLDCGRKFIPMDYLYKLVDVMAYYKMNVLHIHLNDNGFKYFYDDDWDKTQAAFRLESETYPGLTARDGAYSKEEFRDFQKYAMSKGVEIVPEIDFPAHALAFTRFRPEIGSSDEKYGCDHLDITKEATYTFLDSLLTEYIGGDNPVFIGPSFHIGTDEYSNRDSAIVEKFRYLTDRYIRFTEKHGKRPLVWGSLTHAKGKTPVKSDGVLMYLWSNDFAEPKDMLEAGYDLISIPDGQVYIVPAADYYRDYLDSEWLYNNWTPAQLGNRTLPDDAPQLKGGMFAVWNDHPGNGITVKDIHHRVMAALPAMSAKTWNDPDDITVPYDEFAIGAGQLSEAPGVNYLGRHYSDRPDGLFFEVENLYPSTDTGIEEVGYDYTIEFDIEGADEEKGTILFESPSATVWLSDPILGTLAFSREDKLYHFRHDIRKGEKNHIRISGNNEGTRLWVDGRLVDNLDRRIISWNGHKRKMSLVRTLVFPLALTGNFRSKITNFKAYNR